MGRIVELVKGKHYSVIVESGRDPKTGKRTRIKRTIKGRQHEAEMLLLKMTEELQRGVNINNKTALAVYLKGWITTHNNNLAATTAATYKAIIDNHLIPELGQAKLSELSPEMMHNYFRVKLITLTPRSVQQHHAVLSKAINDAVRLRLIPYNPISQVSAPRPSQAPTRTLTVAEVQKLLKALSGHRYANLFTVAAYTGLRLGELLALRWEDIKLPRIYVRRSLSRVGGENIIGSPKSKKTRSTIAPRVVVNVLNSMEKKHDLVFCNDGQPLSPTSVSASFIRGAKKAGYEIRFHDLRHSYATQLAEMGVNPKVVQELLGHHDVAFTLNSYTHAFQGAHEEVADKYNHQLMGTEWAPNGNGLEKGNEQAEPETPMV